MLGMSESINRLLAKLTIHPFPSPPPPPTCPIEEYSNFVEKTSGDFTDLNYAIVALNGEAGEVAEWHKKANLRKQPGLTDADLLSELGDVLWYVTKIANLKGWSLEHVMKVNQIKLQVRINRAKLQAGGRQ